MSGTRPFTIVLRGLALALALFLAGCASTKQLWNGRLGNFTFDQAVLEMGPPDKSAKLTDGTTVHEWLVRSAQAGPVMIYPSYRHRAYAWPYYTDASYAAVFVRLTFAPDGRLKEWKHVHR